MIKAMAKSYGFVVGVVIGAVVVPGPASAGMALGAFATWLYACRVLTIKNGTPVSQTPET